MKKLLLCGAALLLLAACADKPVDTTASTTASTTETPAVVYSLSNPVFGVNPLSANGTTSVSVDVYADGVLATKATEVFFNSVCAARSPAKATISSSTFTIAGKATANYEDRGCSGDDIITASVIDGSTYSAKATLTVNTPDVGSIQVVSVNPTTISLKGTGGVGLQETAKVTFKVVDVSGNPLPGKKVNFSLNTAVGGLSLVTTSALSGTDGLVSTTVASGTVHTAVRVTASTLGVGGSTLTTQSDQLTISTGIPDQTSLSVSASIHNIEGWSVDGEKSAITVRLADHFNNPPPDGTAVTFTTEGGSIEQSCITTAGACTVTFTSQNPRPADGRVTVLVYALGEETFLDLDGDGYVSQATELVENGSSTDLGEAFRDDNDDGTYQPGTETFIDFNQDKSRNAPDGFYNGILCNQQTSAQCPAGTAQSVQIFQNITMMFSDSFAKSPTLPGPINLDAVPGPVGSGCGGAQTFSFLVADKNNNEMPNGTTVAITTDNGTLVGTTSFTVGDSIKTYNPAVDKNYSFTIKGDGTYNATANTCKDSTPSGGVTITVTTPKNNVTTFPLITVNK